ncbi:hypothetical protein jhhlp_000557 [Lomentospora prolificans]|uniref:Uncharacterized protein n=1 Tax=Lomentospora prolificans TaxID=41688 RepID=A0A2N3NLD8_9PEZI|nr:hypothetical protein jhhlp_000557 [Lomentospora prolificans]
MPVLPPSGTLSLPSLVLAARQATITVQTTTPPAEKDSGLNGGAIAGIVIGSVFGIILLIWLLYSCTNLGAPPSRGGVGAGSYDDSDSDLSYSPRRRRRRHHGHHHHRRHHRHPRREVRETSSSRPVIVESRSRSRGTLVPQRVYTGRTRSRDCRTYYV